MTEPPDRRSEKLPFQLRVHYPHSSEHGQAASPAHILAAVRSLVESGTIKGEVVDAAWGSRNPRSDAGWTVLTGVENPGTYYIIPVSDGGSET